MRVVPLIIAATALAGCARDDTVFPSLAPREAESRSFAEPAIAPPTPARADPALDQQLADWTRRLNAIVKGFDADVERANRAAAVAGARTVGSDVWIAAQTALATLDDWRAQAGGLATELDDASRERVATAGAPYPSLDALRGRAASEAERQAAAIAALGARLPQP